MKLLLDTCVWGGVKKILEEKHDVVWCGDWVKEYVPLCLLVMKKNSRMEQS